MNRNDLSSLLHLFLSLPLGLLSSSLSVLQQNQMIILAVEKYVFIIDKNGKNFYDQKVTIFDAFIFLQSLTLISSSHQWTKTCEFQWKQEKKKKKKQETERRKRSRKQVCENERVVKRFI